MKGELITCQLIERTLTSVGIESLSVTKSTEAPSLLSRDRFSVVFLDDQRSSVELSLQLNKAMAPIVGTGSVVRVQGQGKMGVTSRA